MNYQEWSCARQKSDETATERCIDSANRDGLVWHAVANGGSWVETDKESYI